MRPLFKALYGHIEAPKLWNKEWSMLMLELGFVQSKRDPCLWVHPDKSIFIVLYVDDSLIAAKTLRAINKLISSIKSRFKIRELGMPTQFLGMTVNYFQDQGVLLLSQDKYIMKLQQHFLASSNPRHIKPTTPIVHDFYKSLDTATQVDTGSYRALVGGLIFIAISTRPDISFAVSLLTQAFSAPTDLHVDTAMRCLAYLSGTSSYGISLGGPVSQALVAFSDSDWANCPSSRKSMGGFVIFYGGSPVSWSSKRHRGILALSTTEAEYVQLSLTVREILWMQPIFVELGVHKIESSTLLMGDNTPALSNCKLDSTKGRTKHMDVRVKFLGEVYQLKKFDVQYVTSQNNWADIFTKPLATVQFRRMRSALVQDQSTLTTNRKTNSAAIKVVNFGNFLL